jgi:hypothetical protein
MEFETWRQRPSDRFASRVHESNSDQTVNPKLSSKLCTCARPRAAAVRGHKHQPIREGFILLTPADSKHQNTYL